MDNINRALDALHSLDPGCDRGRWVRIGMAAKAAGIDFDTFDSWSSNGGNYVSTKDCASTWNSFKGSGISAATLFRMALDAGWQDPAKRERMNGYNGHAKAQEPPKATRKPEDKPKGSSFNFEAVWSESEAAGDDHPYIAKKLGLSIGLRTYRGCARISKESISGALLVPAYDAAGVLQTFQAILPSGSKLNAPRPLRPGVQAPAETARGVLIPWPGE